MNVSARILLRVIAAAIFSKTVNADRNFSREVLQNGTNPERITPIMFVIPKTEENPERELCTTSDDEFPTIFTDDQLTKGAVVVCFLIGIYSFTLLAIVCDKYFLPSVEKICESLKLPQDVAAATFMAMATSAPEFFVNMIGTFITKSDIGIGTVVGSNMYNTLGVAAIGSLAASYPIQLAWWPVTRDCVIYIVSVIILVAITWDGQIYWYEGLAMLIAFLFYFIILFNNKTVQEYCTSSYNVIRRLLKKQLDTLNMTNESDADKPTTESNAKDTENPSVETNTKEVTEEEKFFEMPEGSWQTKMLFVYTWPLRIILFCTVPNPKTKPQLFPLTFILCVIWIGMNSYLVSWMLSLIGTTFGISDSILGLTLLAAGGDLPESISITIMSRRGEGSIGVSNALGANTINILMSLGLPWFIKTIITGANNEAFIEIASGSIQYTILGLTLVAAILFLTLFFNKFRLSRKIGVVLCVIYAVFLILAILSESLFMNAEKCTT